MIPVLYMQHVTWLITMSGLSYWFSTGKESSWNEFETIDQRAHAIAMKMRRMENDTDEYMMGGKILVHPDGCKLKLVWIQLGSEAVISTWLAPTDPWVCVIMITLTHVLIGNIIVDMIAMTTGPFPAGHPVVGSQGMVESTSSFLCIWEKSGQITTSICSVITLVRGRVGISLVKCGIFTMSMIIIIIMTTAATRDKSPLWWPRARMQSPHAQTRGRHQLT